MKDSYARDSLNSLRRMSRFRLLVLDALRTERHAQCGERTGINHPLLLDFSFRVHPDSPFASEGLYYSQIQLTHLLAPFPLWRPLIPFNVAPLRLIPFALARMKNSLRILCHFHLRIVLDRSMTVSSLSEMSKPNRISSSGMIGSLKWMDFSHWPLGCLWG